MKATLQSFAASVLIVLSSAAVLYAQGTTIAIVHLRDTHSHLDAIGPNDANLDGTLGGIALDLGKVWGEFETVDLFRWTANSMAVLRF